MQETGGKNRPQNEIYAMNVELFIVIWQEKWCANIDVTMIFKKEPSFSLQRSYFTGKNAGRDKVNRPQNKHFQNT